ARLLGERATLNAHMDRPLLARHVALGRAGERLLAGAGRSGRLSARGIDRVLRVARTIADLDGRERGGTDDLEAAGALRPEQAERAARTGDADPVGDAVGADHAEAGRDRC